MQTNKVVVDRHLTQADAEKLVEARLKGRDAEHARTMHMATKMGDLPEVYRNLLPATSDQKALYAAEQTIRRSYINDMKAHAPKFSDITPPPAEAQRGPVDIVGDRAVPSQTLSGATNLESSKLSASQLISLGLSQKAASAPAKSWGPTPN